MLKELISASLDLYLDQGDTYYKTFTIRDDTNIILNLTGLTVTAVMKRYHNSSTDYPLIAEITNAVGGVITVSMPAGDTIDLIHSRYVYSIKLSDGVDTTKIMSGQVLVAQE